MISSRVCGNFSEGLAPVRIEGRYGYVDGNLGVAIVAALRGQ